MPGIICWKNKSSVLLGCNERAAQSGELLSPGDIVGKRDNEMIWGKGAYAEAFQADD